MIYKRAVAKLRAQDWFAIGVELAIVIVGVFIGIWVSNWNQERIEQNDLQEIIGRLSGDIDRRMAIAESSHRYFDITGRYAGTAFAAWQHDPRVSDRDFAVAAYQASQITAFNNSTEIYSTLLGGDQVRKIQDRPLRDAIIRLLNFNFEPISLSALRSRYRDDVRAILPDSIQTAVRASCSDRTLPSGVTALPSECNVRIDPARASAAAAALRAHPELVQELNQHRAQVAIYLYNVDQLVLQMRAVRQQLDERDGRR
jgi:hypothetical protein